jgi:hypothetical protein
MGIIIQPSDLKYRYPRDVAHRGNPKFAGKPDMTPFNRDDLYEILPMMAAAMDALGSDDGRVLHLLEDILNHDLPRCVTRREDVFDCLVGIASERIESSAGS